MTEDDEFKPKNYSEMMKKAIEDLEEEEDYPIG